MAGPWNLPGFPSGGSPTDVALFIVDAFTGEGKQKAIENAFERLARIGWKQLKKNTNKACCVYDRKSGKEVTPPFLPTERNDLGVWDAVYEQVPSWWWHWPDWRLKYYVMPD